MRPRAFSWIAVALATAICLLPPLHSIAASVAVVVLAGVALFLSRDHVIRTAALFLIGVALIDLATFAATARVGSSFSQHSALHVDREVQLDVPGEVTQRSILDALESRYPMLRGTIRDHVTQQRRAFLRFFACEEDLSHDPPDTPLPDAVVSGTEPFFIIGAIAGG